MGGARRCAAALCTAAASQGVLWSKAPHVRSPELQTGCALRVSTHDSPCRQGVRIVESGHRGQSSGATATSVPSAVLAARQRRSSHACHPLEERFDSRALSRACLARHSCAGGGSRHSHECVPSVKPGQASIQGPALWCELLLIYTNDWYARAGLYGSHANSEGLPAGTRLMLRWRSACSGAFLSVSQELQVL